MSSGRPLGGGAPLTDIKEEVDVVVKLEPAECALCGARGAQHALAGTHTGATGTPLLAFLQRFTRGALAAGSRALCAACLQLVNVLDRAERDYRAVKESFELLLSKSSLFEAEAALPTPSAPLACVKSEQTACQDDSEDEPLARTKKKHGKGVKKKKKTGTTARKRKTSITDKWECEECGAGGGAGGARGAGGAGGGAGGAAALAAHRLAEHADHSLHEVLHIKTEDITQDPDRSHSPFNNGTDIGFGDFDDDDEDGDSTFNPEEFLEEPQKKTKSKATFKRPKTWHPCDICSARYSSLARLEQHKRKHDGSKPPYICEVCGAHYKHKRACDIHIALHKGISDWKCEECNKLFPSKNALQRHNNIHTGKLNYQCDLCGKSFIHTSSFKMHKLSHSGVKPHACDVCGLALMTRSHLKRHKRIHSGEKRHECALCGKRFSERYNLAAHAKSHEAAPPGAAPPPPPGDAAPRRRLFRCHFCTERFERRYMLERHMSVLHGRTLERPPPTPRNTMSKLLKAQAQARHAAPDAPAHPHPRHADGDSKESGAPDAAGASSKLLAQLTSASPSLLPSAWGASYAEISYVQP